MFFFLTGCVHDSWNREQLIMQGAVFALKGTDYVQTKNCIANGGHEVNPLMQRDGGNLDIVFATFFILEPTIAHFLSSKWRTRWLYLWAGQGIACVTFNLRNN